MANRIKFEALLDPTGFITGLKQLEAAAFSAQQRLEGINRANMTTFTGAGEGASLAAFNATQKKRMEERVAGEKLVQHVINDMQAAQLVTQLGSIEKIQEAEEAANAKRIAQMERFRRVAVAGGVESAIFGGHGLSPGGGGSFSGAVRESFVLLREGLRGNWNRMTGSLTLLAGYTGTLGKLFSSTAASAVELAQQENTLAVSTTNAALASEAKYRAAVKSAEAAGMDSIAIGQETAALRANSIAAAEAADAQIEKTTAAIGEAELAAASATSFITPVGYAIAAVALLSFGVYALFKHFTQLGEARDNFNRIGQDTEKSFIAQVKASEEAQKALQSEKDRLLEITKAEQEHKDAIQDKIKAMQQEAQEQEELARLRGMPNVQIAQMDLNNKRQQLDYLNQQIGLLKTKLELDKSSEQMAVMMQAQSDQHGAAKKLESAKDAQTVAASVMEQFRSANKISAERGAAILAGFVMGGAGVASTLTPSGVGATDKKEYEINGKKYYMSFNEAMAKSVEASKAIADLTPQVKGLADSTKDHKGQTDKDLKSLQDLQKQSDELTDSVKNQERYGSQKAALEDLKNRRTGGSAANGLIQSGNFLGLSSNAISSMQAKLVSLAQQQVRHLASIDSKMGSHSGKTGFSF